MSKRNTKSRHSKPSAANSTTKTSASQGSTHPSEKSLPANPPQRNGLLLGLSLFLMVGWLSFLAFVALFK